MAVMIGIDPHKGSHTAVAVGTAEEPLGKLRVRACPDQAGKLVAWAQAWPERTWAVKGARGLGRLLAQQLVAAGERVLDVQPKLAVRVRLLEAGDTNKTDPDDARSVAVAALRSKGRQEMAADGHAVVLKVWAKRHRDLSRARNQVVCRLHAVLCELIPAGCLTRSPQARPPGSSSRWPGPFRRPQRHRPGRGVLWPAEDLPAVAARATGVSTMPSIWPRSPRSGTSTATAAPTTSASSPRGKTHKEALRCLKRRISDAIYARLRADARKAGPGGQPGNDTGSSVTGSHPEHRLFGQATSGPEPSLRAPATFTQATPAPEQSAKKIQRAT